MNKQLDYLCPSTRGCKIYLYFLWEGCREHHSLPLTSRRHSILLNNTPDLGLKTHVQHTISLVQYQEPVNRSITLNTNTVNVAHRHKIDGFSDS